MKKRYFKTVHKETVTKRVLRRKFDPIREQQEQELSAFAHALVLGQLTEQDWALIGTLPPGWLPRVIEARFQVWDNPHSAGYHSVRLPETVTLPATLYQRTYNADNVGPDLWGQYCALRRMEAATKEEERTLKVQIEATLNSFRTVEDAVREWPEIAPIIHDVCGTSTAPKNLPAITGLNEALDLPPEAREAGAKE